MPSAPADDRADDRPLPGRLREARANDTAVLAAAREVFAAQGHGASMADVARHAGVGVGSVYRRYPTKEALVEALHVQAVRGAARLATEVADQCGTDAVPEADGAVGTFLARQITGASGPILRPPGAGGPLPADLAAATRDLRVGLERLVAYDRAAGLLPTGFTTADVMQLLLHLRPALPFPRAEADALHLRYLRLVLAGLRSRAGEDAGLDGAGIGDGPSWDEWVGAWHD
ncbi:helix-turn-helix domain-containing protein [Isoptericola sp. NPDC056605]|uniref:TetR/AcrR family transcriptional regulator n=1 Tax=Isoptericola sp. NPDC056605 TaxID=3345876 RepID=UPI0036C8CE9D